MREIKFRAWHKKENFMLEPKYIKHLDWNDETIYYVGGAYRRYELDNQNNVNYLWKGDSFVDKKESVCDVYFDDINLMQYTGLKDKNRIEIYEGDILQSTDKKENEKNKWIGVVEDNNFGWVALKYKEYLNPSWLGALSSPINEPQTATWISSMCEVIGNIYENSELLRED